MFGLGPRARTNHGMEFDHATGRVILYGGYGTGVALNDTWEYFNLTRAVFEPLGVGCAGSAGTPVLAPVGTSKPWIGETFHLVVSNAGLCLVGAK